MTRIILLSQSNRSVRLVVVDAALVASHHTPVLRTFAERLRAAGTPHKVVIAAVTRKLVTRMNAQCKPRQK